MGRNELMKNIENQILIIFGASGDLTLRKLIPAVFDLFQRGFLPENYAVLGVSRTRYTDDEFRKRVVTDNKYLENSGKDKTQMDKFSQLLFLSLDQYRGVF